MRRFACMLLLLTPAVAWASSGMAEADHGTCITPGSAAHGPTPEVTVPPSHSPGRRSSTVTPSGGGDDGDLLPPRNRMPKWHSFLPGMFR